MFSEELKTLRSNFLVHWTGKDLEERYTFHPFPIEVKRAEYMQRLIGTLKEGLWMNKQPIELYDKLNKSIERVYEWPATCFTEIKLTQIKKHTDHYGRLGFGFSREFVMQRYGAPVLYIAETDEDIISPHLFRLYKILQFMDIKTIKFDSQNNRRIFKEESGLRKFVENCELAKFLSDSGFMNPKESLFIFGDLLNSIITISIFTKRMSETTTPHDFQYLDEFEWRIPYTTTKPKVKPCIKHDVKAEEIASTDKRPIARIRFYPDDLKVLIFPDDETRKMASDDEFFQCWLKERNGFPIMVTVDECTQF